MTDAKTFDVLVKDLHRRARAHVSCPHEAADLAQEAALKLWQRQCRGDQPDDLTAYAMTVLRNHARSRWRARKPLQGLEDTMAPIAPEALCRIACRELRAAIADLPCAQSELLLLVADGETSPTELARITGQPLGTVMSRLSRARASLRKEMGLGQTDPVKALYTSPGDP